MTIIHYGLLKKYHLRGKNTPLFVYSHNKLKLLTDARGAAKNFQHLLRIFVQYRED